MPKLQVPTAEHLASSPPLTIGYLGMFPALESTGDDDIGRGHITLLANGISPGLFSGAQIRKRRAPIDSLGLVLWTGSFPVSRRAQRSVCVNNRAARPGRVFARASESVWFDP
ncbi:hypothetical protein QQF64_019834 [Cirrhinus molitorella]|uniref:Uncharacterized protein n=1 Tax=Cirrhinus molitorella TaxID=172907 RepID=A0ABR3LGS4_9TELE